MQQVTVEMLLEYCKKEVKKGNGKKQIVISDDTEGNGYHGMFFGFTPVDENTHDIIYDSNSTSSDDTIILG